MEFLTILFSQYSCGHRCKANCHSGVCPDAEQCRKKVKLFCPCRRIKKDLSCESIRKNGAQISCDDLCKQKKDEEKETIEREIEAKKQEELERNQRELEQFEKKFHGKKKNRERRRAEEVEERSWMRKYWFIFPSTVVLILAVYFVAF